LSCTKNGVFFSAATIFGAAKTKFGPYHFVRPLYELFQRDIVGFEKNVLGTFEYDHLIVMGSGIRNCINSKRILFEIFSSFSEELQVSRWL
jgi:hypothetical protein